VSVGPAPGEMIWRSRGGIGTVPHRSRAGLPLRETLRDIGREAGAGAEAAGFFSSIISGFLLGFLLDRWLGTEPVLVIVGIVAGSITGFLKMWQYAKKAG